MMAALTAQDLMTATGGCWQGLQGESSWQRVSTDSRDCDQNTLFVALRGERFDAHDFLPDVAATGAAAVVSAAANEALPLLQVADTQIALADIAGINRARFKGPLVGLTGSSGKTSSKEMIASILAQCGQVRATAGNLNNEIGVPLSLLSIDAGDDYAVIEMGAAKSGDIAYLCRFARPDIRLLTNAQEAHLGGFGSVETIAETKGEIFDDMTARHTAVINADSPWFDQWFERAASGQRFTFSLTKQNADFHAGDIAQTQTGQRFRLHSPQGDIQIELPWPGQHSVANALGAAACALAAGADLEAVRRGLAALPAIDGRLREHALEGNICLIDDSYNANPSSVKAAIDVLAERAGRRVLVLGCMAELGADSAHWHQQVAEHAAAKGISALYCVGECAGHYQKGFGEALVFDSRQELAEALLAGIESGDTILIKGSRSAAMDDVVRALLSNLPKAEGH